VEKIVASWGAASSALTPYQFDRACDLWRSKDRRYRFNINIKCNGGSAARVTSWRFGAQRFEPALPVLRMNRPAGRFTSSAPTVIAMVFLWSN
jgi:hypothetical protein